MSIKRDLIYSFIENFLICEFDNIVLETLIPINIFDIYLNTFNNIKLKLCNKIKNKNINIKPLQNIKYNIILNLPYIIDSEKKIYEGLKYMNLIKDINRKDNIKLGNIIVDCKSNEILKTIINNRLILYITMFSKLGIYFDNTKREMILDIYNKLEERYIIIPYSSIKYIEIEKENKKDIIEGRNYDIYIPVIHTESDKIKLIQFRYINILSKKEVIKMIERMKDIMRMY